MRIKGSAMKRNAMIILAAGSILASSPATAITDEEIFRQLRFNFVNPGARSLGFGGAFIAVADDATAAQANPAGLTQLSASELFAELRYIGSDDTSGVGAMFLEAGVFDFDFDFSSNNSREQVTVPSFVSYVRSFQSIVLSVSRQEALRARLHVDSTFSLEIAETDILFSQWKGQGDASLDVTQWNATVAWKPTRWFSIGATTSLSQLDIDSTVDNTIHSPNGYYVCTGPGPIPGAPFDCDPFDNSPVLAQAHSWYSTRIDDRDNDLTYSAGVLIAPTDTFSIGLVYQENAEFEFVEEQREGLSGVVDQAQGGIEWDHPDGKLEQTLTLPARYGAGLKWQPTDKWTLAVDAVRITYSDLLDGLQPRLNVLTSVLRPEAEDALLGVDPASLDVDYTIDDVTEVRLGAEYFFANTKTPWALRFGARTDPDHTLQNQAGSFGEALAGRDDEIHFAVGAGVVLQEKLQLDAAVSSSGVGTEAVISTAYRF